MMLEPNRFFDLTRTDVRDLFVGCMNVWDILPRVPAIVQELVGNQQKIEGTVLPGAHIGDVPVYIGPGAVIEPGSCIMGPAYIGPNVVVRHGAYVRSNCIFLESSLLGHASEAKNCIFLPYAKAPHFAYVGDSILGQRVNLGAGTKLSNLVVNINPGVRSLTLEHEHVQYDTGLRKLGAILGDRVETGCNVVTNPGVFIQPRTLVYPGTVIPKGVYAGDQILKLRQNVEFAQIIVQSDV